MKHQVAITPVRSSGAVICQQRLQPRGAENAAGVLEFGMDGGERRLQLLIGRRQIDGQERDQQDPQRAVEHEGRPRVAQEQADAEHDAGNRDRRGGEEAEHARARDRLARRDIGDRPAPGWCRWSRSRCPRITVFFSASWVDDNSVNTNTMLCSGERRRRHQRGRVRRERGVEQREIRQEHRIEQHHQAKRQRRPAPSAFISTRRGAPYLPPTTE